jgi:hypothetical protein
MDNEIQLLSKDQASAQTTQSIKRHIAESIQETVDAGNATFAEVWRVDMTKPEGVSDEAFDEIQSQILARAAEVKGWLESAGYEVIQGNETTTCGDCGEVRSYLVLTANWGF